MDDIDALRAFNRLYTRELGLLGRSYLASGLGVAEVRVLYELAHGGPWAARALGQLLALDEGHLSRILKAFERRGWLARVTDTADARRRVLSLTEAGRAAMAPVEAESRREIAARLGALHPEARRAVTVATGTMRHALADPALMGEPVTLGDLEPGDAGWVISRHGALYAREEGYDLSFEGLVAGIVSTFLQTRASARDRAWIARRATERLGCVFCVREDDETARLRLFLVEPQARGTGLGRSLLDAALDFARGAGYRRMVLWTHESHRAACALYGKAGFRMTASVPARAFGQDVVDQTWERDL